ncbi:N(4)-(beta-N-acetylglucosaminyl)-L-asparaginase [Carboxylicivirga sp. A043]|uniref:N(4)-(beta-N-acetylglucosaminyl)-L-asparaginase n=1 Tax=Carboxylicivirga litoralis TaxID=2816963 RepID=UPI0021CB18A8|nr:N(4)-(beta-N-acetylglucosaminyl)-L-asparaginase [Carboxylicivirga sp. A043]MCU4158072.1 N(4)-(beta-N-acetylglucosaminyl)-L-asparaginase [Carboxylicivirga sp. A043]
MSSRRKFLKQSGLATLGVAAAAAAGCQTEKAKHTSSTTTHPLAISTWKNGMQANEAGWKILSNGGRAIDAVEQGVKVVEADPNDMSVGYGGRPDRDGIVTLDACIMDETGNAGSVCALENIKHPISVARRVMEKTPHVMLAGDGALQFAKEEGFVEENILTEKAKQQWMEWRKTSEYKPLINIENHDTIGMLALDQKGDISGACTTSGLAYKMHGRVGDSPIIGAGMYCDNEIGGAVATGMGELVMKTLGSFLVVELMNQGLSPQQAVEEAIARIVKKIPGYQDFQIGYLAINKAGEVGAYSLHKGFNYALYANDKNKLIDSDYYLK